MLPFNHSPWEFLIVSDDIRLHDVLLSAIHQFPGEAHKACETTAALAYISRRKLDGIFIDMRIAGALSLLGSIRRGSSNRYSVVFACSAEDEDAARLLNSGVNFVVHRTLNAEKVRSILESALHLMQMERQRYWRHRLTLPVTLKGSGKEQRAVTANISRGGMAVRCRESLAPGSPINFILDLPDQSPIQGQGEVAWANIDGNMGIRFNLLGDQIKGTLWNWIDRHGGNHFSSAQS